MSDDSAPDSVITARLLGKGWDQTQLGSTFEVADLEFGNDTMQLHVNHDLDRAALILKLAQRDSGEEARVLVEYGDDVGKLVSLLISWQERVDPENFRTMIDEIVRSFPKTYLVRDEDMVLLRPAKS